MMRSFWERHFGGHFSFKLFGKCVTVYGWNAMHCAISFYPTRWGYICFRPPLRCFGKWWGWYFYLSPNGTPWASTFAIGPGIEKDEKKRCKTRREKLGHNFDAWKGPAYDMMHKINRE